MVDKLPVSDMRSASDDVNVRRWICHCGTQPAKMTTVDYVRCHIHQQTCSSSVSAWWAASRCYTSLASGCLSWHRSLAAARRL